MTKDILDKLLSHGNGRKTGINPLTLRTMINELLHKERLEKIEVKRAPYNISDLVTKLSLSLEEVRELMRNARNRSWSSTMNDDLTHKLIKLYCATKFCN